MHWSILLVFLALSIIGIWVAYSFLNKNGLYLFCILASTITITLGSASIFSLFVPISIVVFPVVFLAMLTTLHKFGKEEAKKLFFMTLISMTCLFVCNFFENAYLASAGNTAYLTWNALGGYISPIISFVAASSLTLLLTSKIKVNQLKNFLKLALFVAIASGINVVVYSILAYTGTLSFGKIILVLLIEIFITAIVSLGLGYFEKFLNREPKLIQEKQEEVAPAKEEPKEPSVEEIKTPEDID